MQTFRCLIIALALLTACSNAKPAPVVAVTTSASTDAAFLSVAREVFPGSPDADIISLGHDICNGFDRGATWLQELKAMLDHGAKAYEAGQLLGASIAAYCPQYSSLAP